MLTDLSTLPDGVTVHGDLCIIGAGAAGITLARQLAEAGVQVVLLESGGTTEEPGTQRLYRGEEAGIPYLPLDACRLRFFGGTTNHWAGQSRPLEEADFAPRPWVPDSGWPIDHAEFMRYLPAAKGMIGLGPEPFSWDFWAGKPTIAPFPFDPARFEPVVFQYSRPIARFGPLYGTDIERSENILCLLHANVLRLVADPSGEAVSRVDVAALDGRQASVAAEHFVLATGGIENCRILLLSPGPSGVAIGNGHDLVGRYFAEHPCFEVGEIKLSDSPKARMLAHRDFSTAGMTGRFDFKLPPATQSDLRILNHSAHLRVAPPSHAYNDAVGFLSRAWSAAVDRLERWMGGGTEHQYSRNTYKLRVRLEQAPNPESRVTLSTQVDALGLPRTRLDLHLTDLEARTVEAVQEAVAAQLGETGLGRMRRTFSRADPRWQETAIWSDHHLGGTRMHDDSRHGVVDRNCRVHGTSNLYVAGSSVFPTTGHAHPTMSLIALALRLGDHLKAVVAR